MRAHPFWEFLPFCQLFSTEGSGNPLHHQAQGRWMRVGGKARAPFARATAESWRHKLPSDMAVALTSSAAVGVELERKRHDARPSCAAAAMSATMTVQRSDAARNSSRAVSESDRAVEDGRSWMSKEAIAVAPARRWRVGAGRRGVQL